MKSRIEHVPPPPQDGPAQTITDGTGLLPVPVSRSILGARVDAVNYVDATARIVAWAQAGESRYVCVCNVHMVMEGHDTAMFCQVINGADMVTPDGMPLVWALCGLGVRGATRVDGAGLTWHVCAAAARANLPVALYGGTEHSTTRFMEFARRQFPGINFVAAVLPPFQPLTPQQDADYTGQLAASGARIIFVAMGCPKQEQWMALHRDKLPAVLLGVGAAIDFHAGTVVRAPLWMQRSGLEWLFRLCQEPRRLWRRYAVHNPRFVGLFTLQWLGLRR